MSEIDPTPTVDATSPMTPADALSASVAAQQAQITAAVHSAETAVRAALATVAQAEQGMTSVADAIPLLDPDASGLQAAVENTVKLQQQAVEAAIRQAEAAIASAVNATDSALGKLP
jgi:hypothetical protein